MVTLTVLCLCRPDLDRRPAIFRFWSPVRERLRFDHQHGARCGDNHECARPGYQLERRGRKNFRVVFSGSHWPPFIGDDRSTPPSRSAGGKGIKHFLKLRVKDKILGKRIEITALRRDGHEFPVRGVHLAE